MRYLLLLLIIARVCPEVAAFAAPASFVVGRKAPCGAPFALSAWKESAIELSGLLYDSTSTAFDAWEWCNGLQAPAALVAGAVLVTLSETRNDFAPRKHDSRWIRLAKMTCRFLLLSSFAMEVAAIFVCTITGTVLLSHGEVLSKAKAVGYTAPLELMHHHHEIEYLTICIGFLQGLLNWLAALALEVLIPKPKEGTAARRMNRFMASCLGTIIVFMLSFYNYHLDFHGDYFGMLRRYVFIFRQRYFGSKFRPLSVLYVPGMILSAVLGWRAFGSPPELDPDEAD